MATGGVPAVERRDTASRGARGIPPRSAATAHETSQPHLGALRPLPEGVPSPPAARSGPARLRRARRARGELMFWIQLVVVLAAIFVGARLGGIGLGVMGGLGLTVLTFVFHLQ